MMKHHHETQPPRKTHRPLQSAMLLLSESPPCHSPLNFLWLQGLLLLQPGPTRTSAEDQAQRSPGAQAYLGVHLPGDLPDALEPLKQLLHAVRGKLYRRVALLLGLQDKDERLLVLPLWGFYFGKRITKILISLTEGQDDQTSSSQVTSLTTPS